MNRLNQKQGKGELIVTTIDAITEMVINEVELTQNTYEVKVGSNFDMQFFIDFLTEHHFERSDFVYEAGHFSIRGGIIDVFSFSNDMPYRIELYGDEIESIRVFNPIDQLSVMKVDWFYIIPNVQKMVEQKRQTFFDYLPENSIFFTDDIKLSTELLENGLEKAEKSLVRKNENDTDSKEKKEITEIADLYINSTQFFDYINKYSCVEIGVRNGFKSNEIVQFNCTPQPTFHKNFKLLIENLKNNQKAKIKNIIFSDTSKQIERLYTIFNDLDNAIEFEPIYHGLSQEFIENN